MTVARRRSRPGANLPFHRLAGVALVLAAMLPAGLFGVLVYAQVEQALGTDVRERTERALDAATGEINQERRALADLASSYAAWPVFEQLVADSALDPIRDDVLAFLVEQGSATAGVVQATGGRATAGDPTLTSRLVGWAGSAAETGVLSADGSLYLVALEPVASPAGAGSAQTGWILLARRLDARFAADLARLTGFEVALLDGAGSVAVTTDPGLASAVLAPTAAATTDGTGLIRVGDLVAKRLALGEDPDAADLLLVTRLPALQAAAGGLPVLVLGLLGVTGLLAAALAATLSLALRRRLAVIYDGLTAVADGRVPPARAASSADDVSRLAAGLDRLVATLDRRETVLRRCLAAAGAVPIHVSPAEAAARLTAATSDIFRVPWSRLVESDGRVLATTGTPHGGGSGVDPESRGASTDAPLGLGTDGRRLEAGLPAGGDWTAADQDGLEVMALLAGTVLAEVDQYARAAGRADRLDRLNRLQREFLRSVSHNLRAPLATIELAASDLLDLDADPYVHQRAEAIRLEERRLARLVAQVLLLSRMETGTLNLEDEPLALEPLVRRVAGELGITAAVTISGTTHGEVAFADTAATEQITWILLDNATRYAPGSPIHVEIAMAEGADEPVIVLAVEDEGPGVRPSEERRIFRRFVRGSAGRGVDGTGLGLSVARGLARALGGDVRYRPGRVGARFEVILPYGGGAADAPDPGDDERVREA